MNVNYQLTSYLNLQVVHLSSSIIGDLTFVGELDVRLVAVPVASGIAELSYGCDRHV